MVALPCTRMTSGTLLVARIDVLLSSSNPAKLRSIYGLTRKGIKLVIAGSGVPVGSYTLQVLKNMNLSGPGLANVVSRETDVREVLAKVALGEADAGFVYATDAKVDAGKVKVIKVPAWAQPKVQYGICIVSRSSDKADAQAFINKVMSKTGQAKLRKAGFLARVKAVPKKGYASGRRCAESCSSSWSASPSPSRSASCCCRSSRCSCTRRRGGCSPSSRATR